MMLFISTFMALASSPATVAQTQPQTEVVADGIVDVSVENVAPIASEQVAAEPVASEPVATAPVASEPVAAEPVSAEPVAAEPVAAEPVAVVPIDMKAVREKEARELAQSKLPGWRLEFLVVGEAPIADRHNNWDSGDFAARFTKRLSESKWSVGGQLGISWNEGTWVSSKYLEVDAWGWGIPVALHAEYMPREWVLFYGQAGVQISRLGHDVGGEALGHGIYDYYYDSSDRKTYVAGDLRLGTTIVVPRKALYHRRVGHMSFGLDVAAGWQIGPWSNPRLEHAGETSLSQSHADFGTLNGSHFYVQVGPIVRFM